MKNKYRLISNKKMVVRGGVTIFLLNTLMINDASAETLYIGFNELGETSVNIIGDSGEVKNKTRWDGLAFNISKTNSSSQCNSPNQTFPQKTIDGYTGYELSPGFLFVIYSGALSGYRGFSDSIVINYSYIFSSSGVLSPSTDTESPWCADPRRTDNLGAIDIAAPWGETTGSIRAGIYVSPSVNINSSVSVPSFYVNRGRPVESAQGGPLIKGTGVTYTVSSPPLQCSISAPPTIDFGTVNLWNFAGNTTGSPGGANKDVLSVVDGNLSISCERGDSQDITTTATKLTLSGKIPAGGFSNDLDVTMDNSGNPAPATIRASIKNIVSPCLSSGGTTFSGSNSKIDINGLSVGENSIPYRFSLCSRPAAGINQFGSASAQATITLDWD
jgi:hypothetical protein